MKKLIVLSLILCFVAISAQADYFTSFEASEGYVDDTTLNGAQGWSILLGYDRGKTWSAADHGTTHDPGPAALAGSGSQYARLYGNYNVAGGRTGLVQNLDETERIGSGKENAWSAEGSSLMSQRYTASSFEGAFTYFGTNGQGWAAQVGFWGNNFAYYDGATLVQTTATVSNDTWYEFDVVMNCGGTGVTDTYDLIISNAATEAQVISVQDLEWRNEGVVDYISDILILSGRPTTVWPEWYNAGATFFDDVSVQEIPEPATMILLLGGALSMVIRRKK